MVLPHMSIEVPRRECRYYDEVDHQYRHVHGYIEQSDERRAERHPDQLHAEQPEVELRHPPYERPELVVVSTFGDVHIVVEVLERVWNVLLFRCEELD